MLAQEAKIKRSESFKPYVKQLRNDDRKTTGRREGAESAPQGRGLKVIKKQCFSQKMDNISGTKTDRTNP